MCTIPDWRENMQMNPDEWGSVEAAGPKKHVPFWSQAFWLMRGRQGQGKGKPIIWKLKTAATPQSTGLFFSAYMQVRKRVFLTAFPAVKTPLRTSTSVSFCAAGKVFVANGNDRKRRVPETNWFTIVDECFQVPWSLPRVGVRSAPSGSPPKH
jgi:hypothetical protein